MTRFNQKRSNPRETINFEGEKAYNLSPELDLYSQVCTASLQPKFYSSNTEEQLNRLRKTIAKVNPELVCKLAVYAREKMYLRSIPLVLIVELLKNFNDGKQCGSRNSAFLRKSTTRVIQRADEITEILSYFTYANNRTSSKKLNKLPNLLKKAVGTSFNKFDEYQLAKYNRNNAIKLRDALFLTHPKPKDSNQEKIFKKLVEDNMDVPYTWEVEFSKLGQQKFISEVEKNKVFAAKWEELVKSNRLGYMALLRNLRNILKYGTNKSLVKLLCEKISDPVGVEKSKQLPFRFWSAYRSIGNEPKRKMGFYSNFDLTTDTIDLDPFAAKEINKALEKAVKLSVGNIKGFEEDTRVLIACDVSGSMQDPISKNSTVMMYDIGLLLGQLLQFKCKNVLTGFFGDSWKLTDLTSNSVLNNTMNLYRREGEVGYSTNGWKVINWLNTKNIEVDKIMIFTDCQLWNSSIYTGDFKGEWKTYSKNYPNCKLYLFDLQGYGKVPLDVIEDNRVHLISGWSDKIFEIMDSIENGVNAIDFIKNIKI